MSGSIATKKGDGGQTALVGGLRVSKASSRVDAYGNVDELISALGFARAPVCRRAERGVVWLSESEEAVQPNVLAYLNRLSDLLWLFGRKLEHDAGVNGSLRAATGKSGHRWSRAW